MFVCESEISLAGEVGDEKNGGVVYVDKLIVPLS